MEMRRKVIGSAILLVIGIVASSCGSDSTGDSGTTTNCSPGKQEACACPGGETGVQQCRADGSGWEPCSCDDAGASGQDAGNDAQDDSASDSSDVGNEAEPCTSPVIVGVSPTEAALKRKTTFTINGGCLPDTATPTVPNCTDLKVDSVSDTEVVFTCAPSGPLGMMHVILFDKPAGDIIADLDVDVVYGYPKQSCDEPLNCNGPNGQQSCCSSIDLPAGTYMRGRSLDGTDKCPDGMTCDDDELPEHVTNVNAFGLDTYEVTIGRFRRFVEAYDGTALPKGAGANPSIPDSGWKTEWNAYLPQGQAELRASLACSAGVDDVWTDVPGVRENNAVQCLNWYTAFAFCIWDGGRLPTEAEWEYVAAGGAENRLYPWGQEEPDNTRMKVECAETPCLPHEAEDVGTRLGDMARWGHLDTGGGVREWTLDGLECGAYETLGGLCDNCACLHDGPKYQRGGRIGLGWTARVALRVARAADTAGDRVYGVRCAR